MSSQRFHVCKSLLICLMLLCAATKSVAQKDEKWRPYPDTDPITRETTSGVSMETPAYHSSASGDYFQVVAICNSQTFNLKMAYLPIPNPGFMNSGFNKILISRMNIDGDVRIARSLPTQNYNSATFVFAPQRDRGDVVNDIGQIADAVFAKLPGTPSELVKAKEIMFEIRLADANNPILRIHPQDSGFQKYATQCKSDFPAIFNLPPVHKIPPNMAELAVHEHAGSMVYLLHDDFTTTMNQSGYPVPPETDARTVFLEACGGLARLAYLQASMNDGHPILGHPQDQNSKCAQMFQAITADPAAMKPANLSGTVVLQPVDPGTYHVLIFSYYPGEPNPRYWDEKITLTAGTNSFTAGPDNAKPLTTPTKPLTADMNNPSPNLAVLTIHNTIPGQPNPLARTPFNLMRDDFATTVQRSGIRVQPGTAPPQAFAKICGPRDAACISRLLRASVAGAAATAVSSPTGDATLPPVQPGEYYLLIYGYDASHRNIFWNEKITLTAGANSFTAGVENAKPFR